LSLSVEAGAQKHEFANYKRYAKANSELPQVTKKDKRVVFMGNSITEGWVIHRGDWFKENPNYVGRGIGGQTSYQFLLRFREDVVKLNPKVVVINAGTNDVAENTGPYNEEFTFNNIVSMVDIAKANKIKVILTSVLPAARFGWHPHVTDAPEKIISLNKIIQHLNYIFIII
jgi:lysophospholipase L1-like esterase